MSAKSISFRAWCWFAFALIGYIQPASALPRIQHWQTERGSRVYFVHTEGLPLVDLRLVFDAGSARDSEQFGIASLTSTLLDSGAGEWDADAIAQRLESVGAQLSFGVSRDMAWASLRSLTDPKLLTPALETTAEVLAHPRFAATDFEREKQRVLAALKQREESPSDQAAIALFKAIYGSHPYAHPADGLLETVSPLTAEQVKTFHATHYVAANAVAVIVGDLSEQQARTIADTVLAGLPTGSAPAPIPPAQGPSAVGEAKTRFPSVQTHVYAGTLGMRTNDPDFFPLTVGNHILGGSGLVSRLSEEVREKRGLSYGTSSFFATLRGFGPFVASLQTRNDQAEQALKVMLDTIKSFVAKGPSETELAAAKKNITGGFVLRLDSNKDITEQVAAIAYFQLPEDWLERYTSRVEKVTAAEIKDAFQRRLKLDTLQTVLVGGEPKAP